MSNNMGCGMHTHQQPLGGSSYAGVVAGRHSMDQQQQMYHHQHHSNNNNNSMNNPSIVGRQQAPLGMCDYAAHNNMMPHSKSMDHYNYPTVLGDHLQATAQGTRGSVMDQQLLMQSGGGGGGAYELGNLGHLSRSHGNMRANNNGYYDHPQCVPQICPSSQAAAAAAYNVSGTRYPLPYNLSAQFGNPAKSNNYGSGQWVSGGGNNMYSVVANGHQQPHHHHHHLDGPNQYQPQLHQRRSSAGPPVNGPQYYSELIEPAPMPPPRQPQMESYEESSDDVDRYRAAAAQNSRGIKMKDNQQQTPRTSDFDSYEEMYGEKQQQPHGGEVRAIKGTNSNGTAIKGRGDKIKDGVGSYESWDYLYQSLDPDTKKLSLIEPIKPQNGKLVNGGGITAKEVAQKTRTMSREGANKMQEQMTSLRAVKPVTSEAVGERKAGSERRSSGNHQKSNSMGGGGNVLNSSSNHQRQASDSGVNGREGRRVSSSGTNGAVSKGRGTVASVSKEKGSVSSSTAFPLDSLPPPIITQDDEWSCKHCTFLNESSRRICEICAKSKDFNLDKSSAATCV